MTDSARRTKGPTMVKTQGLCEDLITLNEDPREANVPGANGGVNHFGFRVSDISDLDVAAKDVETAGGSVVKRGEHAPGVPFLYVRDPDGYLIELLA
jgi:catechol 2,3-dioxygenase-like lactoylglutathione lyase family enzyme